MPSDEQQHDPEPEPLVPLVSVADYAHAARKRLPDTAWDFLAAGAGSERAVEENAQAFHAWHLLPRALTDVSRRSTVTSVLGRPLSAPIVVAPVAYHRLFHPDGESAVVRAASSLGLASTVSTFASQSLEEVAAARSGTGPLWFQLYVLRDRGATAELVRRAENCGYQALVVTADAAVMGRRHRDLRRGFSLPPGVTAANLSAGEAAALTTSEPGRSALAEVGATVVDASFTWDGLAELCATTSLPVILKGVMTAADARLADACGAAAVVVSNHGGRQLESAPAPLDVLPEIAEAVGDRCEVLVDGGVRSGGDVLKARALGARAVLVGRPVIWALAVRGEAGVRELLMLLRQELECDMAQCGCPEFDDAGPHILRPRRTAGGRA